MARVVVRIRNVLDHLGDARQRPIVSRVTEGDRASEKYRLGVRQLLGRQPRLASRPPRGTKSRATLFFPGPHPAHRGRPTDPQASRNRCLGLALFEQPYCAHSPAFESFEVSTSHIPPP